MMLLYFLIPITLLLMKLSRAYPWITELVYSNGIYPWVIRPLNGVSRMFSFSIAELGLYAMIFLIVLYVLRKLWKREFLSMVKNLFKFASVMYFLFALLWGFNYGRQSFGEIAGLDMGKSSVEDLKEVCAFLIADANRLSTQYEKPSDQITTPALYHKVFQEAKNGYLPIEKKYHFPPSASLSDPKPILASKPMNYTGITGIYCAYTGEANVAVKNPYVLFPSTTCHEMAHQRGFAREDEANFIAYLACMHNDDVDFQYSGTVLALIHCMNALYDHDYDAWKALVSTYSDKVEADIHAYNVFWDDYEGVVEELSDKINDTYLKSNGQKNGVYSYGRMVDLMIAYYKTELRP